MTNHQKLTISINYQFKVMSGSFRSYGFDSMNVIKYIVYIRSPTDPHQLGSKLYIKCESESHSVLTLCDPWTIEFMEFSRPEFWSG